MDRIYKVVHEYIHSTWNEWVQEEDLYASEADAINEARELWQSFNRREQKRHRVWVYSVPTGRGKRGQVVWSTIIDSGK